MAINDDHTLSGSRSDSVKVRSVNEISQLALRDFIPLRTDTGPVGSSSPEYAVVSDYLSERSLDLFCRCDFQMLRE